MRVSGSASARVSADPDTCYAVVADLGAYPEWYPGVSEVRLLSGGEGTAARLRFDSGIAVLPPFTCVMALEGRRPHRLVPRVQSGPLSVSGEGWEFAAAAGAEAIVTLTLEVEMSVPGGRLAERVIGGRGRRYLIEEPVAALERRVHELAD
jgi:ribosome-associated toxin RatA of RatAB toxin-antitoxin module